MTTPLAILLVTVFLNIAGFSLILPLLPFYGQAFDASPPAIAVLFAAYSFGGMFGEMYWGRLSDRLGRKPVLVITTAGAAVSYVAFAFAPGLLAALLIRVVSGFFSGTFGVVQGALADMTAPQQRARFMGYFGAAFNLGFATGPAIGGLLANPEAGLPGFYTPIFAAAALAAAASAWARAALPETRRDHGRARNLPGFGEAIAYVRSQPLLPRLFAIAFFGIAAFAALEAVFGLWTQRNFAWNANQLGMVFLAMGLTGLLVQTLLIGPLVARFGEPRVIALGLMILISSMLLQPLLRSPLSAVVLMAMLMAGHSLAFPNAGALVSRHTPQDRQGAVMGLNMAANAASRIVAPPLFGWIYSISFDAPFYLCALMMLAMLLVCSTIIRDCDRELAHG
jgi:MFS transporter, DHA1 family, tetracycline resistance protein